MWNRPTQKPVLSGGLKFHTTKVLVRVIRKNGNEQYAGFYLETNNKPNCAAFDDDDIPGMEVVLWRKLTVDEQIHAKTLCKQDEAYKKAHPRFGYEPRMMHPDRPQAVDEVVLASGWNTNAQLRAPRDPDILAIDQNGVEKDFTLSIDGILAWRPKEDQGQNIKTQNIKVQSSRRGVT